ncbi:hypothetical protein LIG30_2489 [Burkholderia sp. lig30]|jgi:hypothetical protein|uniref:hypothetical protein n=1 Tax=Burkholderia sp. lig30 TaxID=1192124 RepID=UPI0004615CED|nr:hypothetical protein [Burkholderia sp. lig30]KDB08438.1 hypothetical protein LIG30_2489 [Burkholderia sp. lig30]
MTLRASAALCMVLAVFVCAAACAVYAFIGPRASTFTGLAGAVVAAAALAACARRACARRVPAGLQVAAGGARVTAFGRRGETLADGQVLACTHWSDLLLVLTVGRRGGRAVSLVIPADALDSAVFRALSVVGRGARA